MENMRYCIGDSFNKDCNHAIIKHEEVEPFPSTITFAGKSVTVMRKDVHKVYCNHPSRDEETFINYIEPYFTCTCSSCPMVKITQPKEKNVLCKIASFFFN